MMKRALVLVSSLALSACFFTSHKPRPASEAQPVVVEDNRPPGQDRADEVHARNDERKAEHDAEKAEKKEDKDKEKAAKEAEKPKK